MPGIMGLLWVGAGYVRCRITPMPVYDCFVHCRVYLHTLLRRRVVVLFLLGLRMLM